MGEHVFVVYDVRWIRWNCKRIHHRTVDLEKHR